MTLNELHQLVAKGESDTLEFKTSTAELEGAFKTTCAFLNHKGGAVLIGVSDKGAITGQDVADSTQKKIAGHVTKLEPSAQSQLEIEHIKIEKNKYVVAILVKKGEHAPYTYDARPFIRIETTTVPMPQHRLEQMIIERGQLNHSYEDFAADGYTLDSLDHEEIYKTIADGIREGRIPASAQKEDVERILARLELFTPEGALKRAAVILYAKPERAQHMIKMARFKGIDKLGEFIDNQQIRGNAFKLLSEADAFLRRHLPIASFFKPDQFKRIDKPILPVLAVREALINAISHKLYEDSGSDISLAIFDNEVELWNSGLLLKKLTIEDLKRRHSSVLRNKHIANVFYVRGLIEKWGIGTNKMIDLCKQDGVPEPEFKEYSSGLSVTFKFKEPIGFSKKNIADKHTINERQKIILAIIKKHGAVGTQQIMSELKNPPTQRTIRNDLQLLKKLNLIELKGQTHKALWVNKE